LKAKALLKAGQEPGTTEIIVDVEDQLPLHLALDYNGSKSVSRNRFGAELTLSKFLLIEGNSLSVRGVMGSDPSAQLYGRTSHANLFIGESTTKKGTEMNLKRRIERMERELRPGELRAVMQAFVGQSGAQGAFRP